MTTRTRTAKLNSISCLFFDYEHKLDNGLERAVSISLCVHVGGGGEALAHFSNIQQNS